MQGFTQDLGRYMQQTKQENMQAHMINHVHIRKVEEKVDDMSGMIGCLVAAVIILGLVILAIIVIP